MKYLGLFVGVDRYASPDISWLSSAARDAEALYSLFGDTFGADHFRLLTDDAATRASIQEEFESLAACDPDDVVIVTFSGHGTSTHELVTFDADRDDLSGSCIPLGTLTEWFERIPARRLVCVLDCCFSGGAGAKVLQADALMRSLDSAEVALGRLSGNGRIIITASTATEEAWEIPRLGHGLLTHHLLEALQGAPEVARAGRIPVYRLLAYVSSRVADASEALGKTQHPTVRGQIDEELEWPPLEPGALFAEHFPDRVRQPATLEVSSLASFGYPSGLLDAWVASIGSLNELQVEAINEYKVLDGQHLVVVAPTSSGKTMIGELVAAKAALERQRAFFLLPLRALVGDKHQEFVRRYTQYGLRVIRATGEIADDIPALMQGQYDLCLMTYEKFTALAVGSPHILNQVGVVVVDELQMLADRGRGANLEFLMTLLKVRRRQGVEPQVIALSGVIGDTNGVERWLNARLLRSDRRPVPLNEGILCADGSYRYIADDGSERSTPNFIHPERAHSIHRGLLVPLISQLVDEGKQVLVFRATRGETRNVAAYLAQELDLPLASEALAALPAGDLSRASEDLRAALAGGVAFHNSDLNQAERQVLEEHFRQPESSIRVIVATTTLAMGVNTPAAAVVIVGLDHPGPDRDPYAIAEYKNMVGRAGRLGFTEEGFSYLVATSTGEEDRFWHSYVLRSPEDIESQFLATHDDPRSLVVRVLAAAPRSAQAGLTATDVVAFIAESFGIFCERGRGLQSMSLDAIEPALGELVQGRLVEIDAAGRCTLTAIGQLTGESGVHVDSVLRVVDALEHCPPSDISDVALLAITQATVELDDVYFPLNRKSTRKEPSTWFGELRRRGTHSNVLAALQENAADGRAPTLRAKRTVSCLYWIDGMPLGTIEQAMTQFGGAGGGASGAVRSVAMRTVDILPVVTRTAELLHPGLDLSARVGVLLTRLELGIPESIVEIGAAGQGRLTRAQLLGLVRSGLLNPEQILAADDASLLEAVSGNQAIIADVRAAARRAQEARGSELVAIETPDHRL